ncbi:D-alanyl-D-alanine carboxypeptidase/D-alanyl-D-alanine-endopeptidase [Leucothrix pacifica]|uniref:Peptidase S13 n=1 Tax=Leucothrix pacifica TaxID=1247513 RepID=A0A317CNN9_9GAMM|nr:D-alanyl-D-alanine carboxypeptidase [Leucothrix pacifica]PWQ99821.1 peptidase S13 [Leucothrix pacifica]
MIRSILISLCCVLALNTSVHANALSKFSQLKNAGLLVVDSRGDTLLADHNNRSFIPASTTKIVTAWLALDRWGENHRFATDFYYDPQTYTLSVKGSGDPFLVSEELAIIAIQLRQLGLSRVDTLVLDGSRFQSGLVLPGTSRTNNPYDAVPSALAANFNTVNLKKVNGRVRSAESQTPLTAYAKSMAKGFKKNKLRVNTGRDPRKAEYYFGELLAAFLKQQGIAVANNIVRGQAPQQTPFYHHFNSRTLGDMIRPMMKYSTNFIANQLVLMMSSEHYNRPANASDVQHYMEDNLRAAFQWQNFSFNEGAGLSRTNRISPEQLVHLLQNFKQWRHLLPEVETGVFAKSGTLKKVSTLAGFIVDNGEWKPFALMMNQSVPYKLRNRIAKELRRTL